MSDAQDIANDAEAVIARQLSRVQGKAARMWQRHEQLALISIVRALDAVATVESMDAGRDLPTKREHTRYFAKLGVAPALRPFLHTVRDIPGGVPWTAMTAGVAEFACSYLVVCGQLMHLRRMARLERYGLSKSTFGEKGLVIEVGLGIEEIAQRFAMESSLMADRTAAPTNEKLEGRLRRRMRSYVEAVDGWFIRYNNDMDIVQAYRRRAVDYGIRFLEREALPDDAIVGDRTFGEWRDASNRALGRILCHIDFAHELKRKRPQIALADVTTIFARKEDIANVWEEAGLPGNLVSSTMNALTLEVDSLDTWERDFEVPCPYYVELGRDFMLLPCFGALSNPYFAFFRHLRTVHRKDWDRAVDRREQIFRQDLANAFKKPRFTVPPRGFDIRREDGSLLTDIDAAIVDVKSGSLALVQLKWNDLFGHSLGERESRRKNVLKANTWIEGLTAWIDGRSASAVAQELGVEGVNSVAPPLIYVVGRYAARFSREVDQDPRAAWLSWFEILHVLDDLDGADPLSDLPKALERHLARFVFGRPLIETFSFSDLTVELRAFPGSRSV